MRDAFRTLPPGAAPPAGWRRHRGSRRRVALANGSSCGPGGQPMDQPGQARRRAVARIDTLGTAGRDDTPCPDFLKIRAGLLALYAAGPETDRGRHFAACRKVQTSLRACVLGRRRASASPEFAAEVGIRHSAATAVLPAILLPAPSYLSAHKPGPQPSSRRTNSTWLCAPVFAKTAARCARAVA